MSPFEVWVLILMTAIIILQISLFWMIWHIGVSGSEIKKKMIQSEENTNNALVKATEALSISQMINEFLLKDKAKK